jgi:hypothetical protein
MADDDLSREVESHLLLLEDEYRRRGMTDEEARRAARLALGGVTQTIELYRQARSIKWLDDARRDAGYALRLLRRNPVFSLTAVLSLAIGIGANTTIFTIANALLLRRPAGVRMRQRRCYFCSIRSQRMLHFLRSCGSMTCAAICTTRCERSVARPDSLLSLF